MFDIGFAELVLILVIGLLVLGPERLPGAIRTTGLWIARLRRSFNDIRSEIEREARIDDIKRDLHNQSILDSLKGTADDLKGTADELGKLRDLPYDVTDVVGRHRKPSLPPARPTDEERSPTDSSQDQAATDAEAMVPSKQAATQGDQHGAARQPDGPTPVDGPFAAPARDVSTASDKPTPEDKPR